MDRALIGHGVDPATTTGVNGAFLDEEGPDILALAILEHAGLTRVPFV